MAHPTIQLIATPAVSERAAGTAGAVSAARGERADNSGAGSHMRKLGLVRSAVFVFCASWLMAQAPPDVLTRSTQAVGYQPGGATAIGFKGTDLMPYAAGVA